MPVQTPHLAIPFRVQGGRVAVAEQDSQQEIESCVEAILSTPIGSRMEEPEYGIPNALFELLPPNPNMDEVLTAIEQWEPRVRVLASTEVEDLVERVKIEMERL